MTKNDISTRKSSTLATESESFLVEKVGSSLESHEIRASQIAMMNACSSNVKNEGALLAEAGTGTGKTFAYLIPAILSEKKVLVSTRTINLQEQLIFKNLAFLSSLRGFDYAIAKGRGRVLLNIEYAGKTGRHQSCFLQPCAFLEWL